MLGSLAEVLAGLGFQGIQKDAHGEEAGFGKVASGRETKLCREGLKGLTKRPAGVVEEREACVAAELGGGTEDGNGAELLENVGIAEQCGLRAGGLVVGLVLANAGKDGRGLGDGEAHGCKDLGGAMTDVGHMVPANQGGSIFGAVTDEDAEIVEKGRGEEDVVVGGEIGRSRGDLPGKGI